MKTWQWKHSKNRLYGTKHCQYCQKHGINNQILLSNYINIPSDAEVYDEEHITYASVF